MEIAMHLGLLGLCIVALYFACEWFLNAVEWLGAKLELGSTAVGSILAAIGTAMPESIVTLMALVTGSAEAREGLAVGSALGGPLVVATVASGAAGVTLLLSRHKLARESRDADLLAKRHAANKETNGPALASPLLPEFAEDAVVAPSHFDADGAVTLSANEVSRIGLAQKWFIGTFLATTILGFVAFPGKGWIGLVLFAVYALYFRAEMKGEDEAASDEGLDALHFQPHAAKPAMWAVIAQIIVCLVVMFWASETFVRQVEWVGNDLLHIAPIIVALLLCPVATELPETLNAIIWSRQGKARLALANVAGSMIIQGTIPAGLAMLGSSWKFDMPATLASITILATAIYLFVVYRKGKVSPWALVGALGFYAAFAVGLVVTSL